MKEMMRPFAEKEWVTVDRCCRILDIGSIATLYRLRRLRDDEGKPLIEVIDNGFGRRQRVLYSGIVSYCDRLRRRYAIPDLRPPLPNPIFRHRDQDLLPFPASDTIYIRDALRYLDYGGAAVRRLCEEGSFWSYQLVPEPGCLWRISRTDFARWMESCRNRRR